MATAIVPYPTRRPTSETPLARVLLTGTVILWLALFLLLPLVSVFAEALRQGLGAYLAAIVEPDALAAIRLTLLVAAIAVPLNVAFGLAAAWALTRFRFRGKSVLVSLIDLPFSVSPVVAGLVLVLLFGVANAVAHILASLHWLPEYR